MCIGNVQLKNGGDEMKGINIGGSNFKKIISENLFFVDKTLLIEEILKDKSEVKLITRPRRFGKTLNMSILETFFDIEKKEENRKYFNGLEIEKSPYMKEQGQYPTIFISLKDFRGLSWEENYNQIKTILSSLYIRFKYVLEVLDESEIEKYNKIRFERADGDYVNSLKNLIKYLYTYYNKQVILLIDEYDYPLIVGYRNHYYNKIQNFMSIFLGGTLKDNPYLKMAIITGILRIVKVGVFSELNNLRHYTVIDDRYASYFGFTESEVIQALNDYEISDDIEDVRYWYDGYKIGGIGLYNPWSITNFLDEKKLKTYWVNTSSNYELREAISNSGLDVKKLLEDLINDKLIEKEISINSDISKILGGSDVWELFLFSGYLTIEEKIDQVIMKLKIPNREVKTYFKNDFIDIYFRGKGYREMFNSLVKNDVESFGKYLQDITMNYLSSYDRGCEKEYHNFVLGTLCYLEEDYEIYSNKEEGYGRYDIAIYPRKKNMKGFVLEFKKANKEEELEEKAKEGLIQIKNKEYYRGLVRRDISQCTLISIAFFKKKVKVLFEEM